MGKIILVEGANANLAYCEKHDWWFTVQRWVTWNEPFFQCMKCRKENIKGFYEWWDSQFEDGNKE